MQESGRRLDCTVAVVGAAAGSIGSSMATLLAEGMGSGLVCCISIKVERDGVRLGMLHINKRNN
jgi:predicted amino acid dehydrogenase